MWGAEGVEEIIDMFQRYYSRNFFVITEIDNFSSDIRLSDFVNTRREY
jgi:hypothetical protein